jgi:gamma-glutamyltranspeptidase / glutathione hydrolase
MTFTTRPEIVGTFGVATSTHWIASAVGMSVLEKGGNAADAAVAMGFVLNVVEPQLNGPLGDLPLMIRPHGAAAPTVICGQGVAPAKATIAHYRAEGLSEIPGSGLLATVVPGAFDAWMLLLQDYGTMTLRDVLAPAIAYAEAGHPVLARVVTAIAGLADFFKTEWPSSAKTWLPGGVPPAAGALFRNPDLAATWKRLLHEAEAKSGREAQIEAARDAFYRGFIAETIGRWIETAEVMDAAGGRRKGVLTADDMARWSATKEHPLAIDYHGWTVWKTGVWGQGPLLLQALRILEGTNVGELDPNGADFVHLVTETLKLAMVDREAYYGDPVDTDIPVETLLSRAYAAERRTLLSGEASREQRPGRIPGFEAWADAAIARAARQPEAAAGAGAGEPTMAHLSSRRGDTVHLDVIDRWGNMVTATPSGGWLQSSPVVPGLGMPLNTRGQMFWLDEGLPTSLAPGRRPRTTLSPSMAAHEGGAALAFGTPGGDQQDQWQLSLFLRLVHHKLNLQEAIDAPLFHTGHAQGSFYPRVARPGHLMAEPAFGAEVLAALKQKGHALEVSEPWAIGRLTAARREPDGLLRAGATPRLMQAYAIGR